MEAVSADIKEGEMVVIEVREIDGTVKLELDRRLNDDRES